MRIHCMMRPIFTCSRPTTGNIVLRIAAHNARIAADAGVQVDRHAPLVLQLPRRGILVVVAPRIRQEALVVRHLLALRVVADLVDQRARSAPFVREVRDPSQPLPPSRSG